MEVKNINKKILLLLILFLFLINIISACKVYANTTGNVYLESNKDVIDVGEEIEISVNIDNFKTAAFTLSLYFDNDKFEFVKENKEDNINVDGNRIIYVWYDKQGGTSPRSGSIETFKFKAKENGIATFNINGEFYTEKGQKVETSFKEKQIQIGKEETTLEKQAREEVGQDINESNSKLQNLRLSIEGMVPEFQNDIFDYYLTVKNDVKDIEVLATAENNDAQVEITGNTNLQNGLNTIKVQVTSPDKTSNSTYLINVTKTNDLEAANTNLETLAIENYLLYPAFDNTVTNYNVEVGNNTEQINLLAIPEDEEATVEIKRDDTLKEGNNEIKITVTARNGYTKKEYNINVYKRNSEEEAKYQEEQKSNQEKLKQIYEIQKTSNEQEQNKENQEQIEKNEQEGKEERNQIVAFFVLIAIVLILASSSILLEKKKNKQK